MKITRLDNQVEMSKRFYLPVVVTDNCPKCGTESKRDLDQDYLNYPVTNIPFDLWMVCGNWQSCDNEWTRKVVLTVSLQEAEPKQSHEDSR